MSATPDFFFSFIILVLMHFRLCELKSWPVFHSITQICSPYTLCQYILSVFMTDTYYLFCEVTVKKKVLFPWGEIGPSTFWLPFIMFTYLAMFMHEKVSKVDTLCDYLTKSLKILIIRFKLKKNSVKINYFKCWK